MIGSASIVIHPVEVQTVVLLPHRIYHNVDVLGVGLPSTAEESEWGESIFVKDRAFAVEAPLILVILVALAPQPPLLLGPVVGYVVSVEQVRAKN